MTRAASVYRGVGPDATAVAEDSAASASVCQWLMPRELGLYRGGCDVMGQAGFRGRGRAAGTIERVRSRVAET